MDSLKNILIKSAIISKKKLKKVLVYWLSFSLTFFPTLNNFVYAGPAGGVVTDGGATISNPDPTKTQIHQTTDRAVIHWDSFNVASNEQVDFQVPDSSSMTLNKVNPANGMSQIYGSIKSNGQVWLVNSAGILFGAGSQVDVAGLMATTANIHDKDFMKGNFKFQQSPDYHGAVINEGTIRVADTGFAALVAPGVSNRGVIQANLGHVTLASGTVFTVDLYGDQLINFGLNADTQSPGLDQNGNPLTAAVHNSGHIYANAGHVMLMAKTAEGVVDNVINMTGVIEAKSYSDQNGTIILSGGNNGIVNVSGKLDVSGKNGSEKGGRVQITGKKVGLMDGAHIDASGNTGGGQVLIGGDYQGKNKQIQNANVTYVAKSVKIDASALDVGDGGKVVVWSDNTTRFYGDVLALGGANGGDGGFVEVSGKENLSFHGTADTRSPFGKMGMLLLDPKNITIASSGTATLNDVDLFSTDPSGSYTIASSLINNATTNVTLEANNDVTFNDVINMVTSGAQLIVRAGRTININANITTNKANISMTANDAGAVLTNRDAGAGNITMASGTTLDSKGGNISLQISAGSNAGTMTVENISAGIGSINLNNAGGTLTTNGNLSTTGSSAITLAGVNGVTINNSVNAVNGAINISSTNGTLVTNGSVKATGTGAISLTGHNGITLNSSLSTNSGAISLSSTASTTVADILINAAINSTSGALTINAGKNLTINNALSTQGMTLTSQGAMTLNSALNAGSGAVLINVNQSGAGANDFTMTSAASITTSKAYSAAAPNAVTINVNNGGGTGSAVVGSIAVNNANPGFISIATNTNGTSLGGSISQLAGTQINTGSATNGKVILAVSQNSASSIQSQISGGQLDLTTGKGGTNINSAGNLTLVAANLNANAPLTLTSGGALTLNAIVNTGLITLNAKSDININQNLTGYGPMVLNADSSNNGSGKISVASGTTVNSSGFDMLIHASSLALNGILNSGAGMMTITASGSSSSIGIGNGASGTLQLDDAALSNIHATGARIFNANNGINLNTNSNAALNATGALTLNADANNDGVGGLTLLGNGTITTNNNALTVLAGSLNLGTGNLNAGTNVLTITATGSNSSILLGDNGGSGTIEISSSQFSQLQGNGKVFNANDGITITNDYQTNGPLTLNADYDANGQGELRIKQGAHVTSNNSPLTIIAATLNLGGSAASGAINSGTGAFTLTATGRANNKPSLGIGNGASGVMTLSDSDLNNKIIANGSRTFNGVDGITITTSPANNNALTLNADYDNNGVGLLDIGSNITINTNNNLLSLTAATMNLGANSLLKSGTGTFSLTATGRSNSQPSLGIGDGANGILNLSNAQMTNQVEATGARIFNGVDGITITYKNFSNNQALTINADYDNNGVGALIVNPNISINSGNGNMSVTAASGNLNGNGFQHGTGTLTITATGLNSPSLGLGDGAGGEWNITSAELTNTTGSGALTFNGRNGITVNYNIPNTANNTLTFNADTDRSGVGTLTVMNGKTINSNNGTLNITAADLNLNTTGAINSGTGDTNINATGSIGIGNAAGTMQISNSELQRIKANNLNLNTVGNFIASDGVTAAAVANITNAVNLVAQAIPFNSASNPNSLNSVVNFLGATSNFKTLTVRGDSGINLNSNIAASKTITLGQGPNTGLNTISVGGNYSVTAADGITINSNVDWSSKNTFTLNANSNGDGVGNFVLANNANLGQGHGNLNITAFNIDLSQGGKINLTTGATGGNLSITGTGSVGLGSASGNMTLTSAVLQKLYANNLTVNSGANQQIVVTGVSLPDTANILSTVNLNATNGSAGGSNVIFQGGDSQFKALNATANNAINIKNNLSVNTTLGLTVNGAGNITQDNGTAIQGTTLSVKTGTGSVILTNTGNKFSNLTANSTSGNIQYTNALNTNLSLNASNLGTGSLTVNTQGTGSISEAGVITANTLNLFTQTGDATLSQNNLVNNLLFTSNSGNLTFKSASNQNLNLLGLNTTGNLNLTQQGTGNLTQSGSILGNNLNLTLGTGTATLNNLSNNVNTLTATSSGGSVNYTDLNALTVNTSSLSTGNLNVVTQTGDILLGGNITAGNVLLNAQAGGINLNGKNIQTPTASGTVSLWAQGAGSTITNATGVLAGKLLNILTKDGSASLKGNFGELIANSTSGNVTYTDTAGRNLQLDQVNLGTGDLTIYLNGNNLTQVGIIVGRNLFLNLGTGSATLNGFANQFVNLDGGNTKGSIFYKNNGDINLQNIALGNAGDLSVETLGSGNINQSTNLSGRNLTLITASGNANLNNTHTNQFTTLTANSSSGTINYLNASALILDASTLGTGTLNAETKTGDISLAGNISGKNVSLDADAGGINLSNHNISVLNQLNLIAGGTNSNIQGANAVITGNSLNVSIQNGVANLSNANNQFNTLTAASTGGSVNYTNKTGLTIQGSNLQLGNLNVITKTQDITLGGDINAGNVSLNAESGGIDLNSHNIQTPLATGTVSLSAQGVGSTILHDTGLLSGKLLTVLTNGGSATLNGNFAELVGNTSGGNLSYTGIQGRNLQLDQVNVGAGNLTINLNGDQLTQTGSIIGNTLILNLGTGTALLNNVSNRFVNLDGGNTKGSITYTNSDNLNLQNIALGSTGDLTIQTLGAGNITQSTSLSGRNLVLNTDSGSANLKTYANQFSTFTANSNSGVMNYLNAIGLTLNTSAVGTGSLNVETETGDISLAGNLSGKNVSLNADTGGINLSTHNISVLNQLNLTAGGTNSSIQGGNAVITGNSLNVSVQNGLADLSNLNNQFNTLTATSTGGTVNYTNQNALTVLASNLQLGNLNVLTKTQDISLGGNITAGNVNLTAESGGINLNNNNISTPLSTGTVTLVAQGLNAGISNAGGILSGHLLNVLTNGGNAAVNGNFAELIGNTSGGNLSYTGTQGRNLQLDQVNVGSGNLTINLSGDQLTQTGAVNGHTLILNLGAGTATLNNNANQFVNLDGGNTQGNISYTNNGDINLQNIALGNTGDLSVITVGSGNITQSTQLSGRNLVLNTDTGSVNLNAFGNLFNTLTANSNSGTVNYLNATGLTVNTSAVGTGTLNIETQTGDISLSGNLSGKNASLNADTGGINLSNQTVSVLNQLTLVAGGSNSNIQGANAVLIGSNLNVSVQNGTADLSNANNDFDTLTTHSTGGSINYTNKNALTVESTDLQSGSLNVTTKTQDITLGGNIKAGNVSLTAESGGLDLNNYDITTSLATGTVTLSAQGLGSTISNVGGDLSGHLLTLSTNDGNAAVRGNFGELIANTLSGNLSYTGDAGRNLQLDQVNVGNGNLTINLSGDQLTQTGAISGHDLILNLGAGSATLNNTSNQFVNLDGGNTKGSISYTNNGDINLQNIALGSTGDLTVQTLGSGNINQSTNLSGRNLSLSTDTGSANLNNTYANQFASLTANSNTGTINYLNVDSLALNASSVGTGDLNVETKTGDISLTGNISGKNVSLSADAGGIDLSNNTVAVLNQLNLTAGGANSNIQGANAVLTGMDINVFIKSGLADLSNANNQFNTLTAHSNSGTINYTNQGTLTVLSSDLQSGALNVFSQTGDINLGGDIFGKDLSLNALTGSIGLKAYSMTASEQIILNAEQNVTGNNLVLFPKLNAGIIQITTQKGYVGTQSAPIGLAIDGLLDGSFIKDASLQTGLGNIIDANTIRTRILPDQSNQYYLYPLLEDPLTATVLIGEDTICTAAYQLATQTHNYHLLPSFCYHQHNAVNSRLR
ncbi:MAG: hypothetical protein JSS53_10575 [Proteobacteria bacterium]|nr:hypothetical protein [Pseudomonadota bacterium]